MAVATHGRGLVAVSPVAVSRDCPQHPWLSLAPRPQWNHAVPQTASVFSDAAKPGLIQHGPYCPLICSHAYGKSTCNWSAAAMGRIRSSAAIHLRARGSMDWFVARGPRRKQGSGSNRAPTRGAPTQRRFRRGDPRGRPPSNRSVPDNRSSTPASRSRTPSGRSASGRRSSAATADR